jgi:hypothetical protein
MTHFFILLIFLLIVENYPASAQITKATVTIQSYPEWIDLRSCERRILSEDDWLKSGLKCASPYYNDCYCNTNLAAVATSYMSSCVFTYCSDLPSDYTAVLGVYNLYCSAQGAAVVTTGSGGGAMATG